MIKQQTIIETELNGRKQYFVCEPSSTFDEVIQGLQNIANEVVETRKRLEEQQTAQDTTSEVVVPMATTQEGESNG